MTPDEQRAPTAFMRVYFDERRPSELSVARPPHSDDAAIVELVDRSLLKHFIDMAKGLQERIREMEASVAYSQAATQVDAAKDEIRSLDELIQTLDARRAAVERSLGLNSD